MTRQPKPDGLHYGNPDTLDSWRCMADVARQIGEDLASRNPAFDVRDLAAIRKSIKARQAVVKWQAPPVSSDKSTTKHIRYRRAIGKCKS